MDRKLWGRRGGVGDADPEVYQVGSLVQCSASTGEKIPCPFMSSLEGLGSRPCV